MSDFAQSRLTAAYALFDAGNFLGAERLAREALSADPQFGRAHALMALALYRRGQFRSAVEAANTAVGLEPSPLAFRAKALALMRLKRRSAAIEAAEAAVHEDPNDAFAAQVLGMALEEAGKRDAANAAFSRAVELAPGNERLHADFGRFLLRQKQFAQAERVAAEISVSADASSVLLLRGELALRRHRPQEARDYALWLLSQDATNQAALRLLTQVKASQSKLLGLWWRYALFMGMRPWWVRLLTMVPIMLVIGVLAHGLALLVIVYLRVSSVIFQRMVRRELKTVKLRAGF